MGFDGNMSQVNLLHYNARKRHTTFCAQGRVHPVIQLEGWEFAQLSHIKDSASMGKRAKIPWFEC